MKIKPKINNKLPFELTENSLFDIEKFTKNKFIKKNDDKKKNLFLFILCLFIFFCFLLIFFNIYFIRLNGKYNRKHLNNNIKKSDKTEINSSNILESYIESQKDFCENPKKYYNPNYESEIFLTDVKLNELQYKIYIYKSRNFLLDELKLYGAFEIKISNYIVEALKIYGSKKNISNNKDIFMLDIGGNIGWYPSFLGRYGYSILSFEAFEKNYYVAKKNFCYLNKNSNVVIITKGLGSKENICNYFIHKNNIGNGMVICKKNDSFKNKIIKNKFIKQSEVKITTLKTFIPFLSDKNIALIKLDVEGHELQVLEGGVELITKYHVPFIVLEFSPYFLKEVGSEPKKLIYILVENGYKISLTGFLSKNYITIDELLKKVGFQINCFFIHNSFA